MWKLPRNRWMVLAVLGLIAPPPAVDAGDPPTAPAAAEPEVDGSAVVATWNGGRLTRGELDGWMAFRSPSGLDESTAPSEDAIRRLVFRKSLAAIAEHTGLDETPRVRLQLEAARQAVLIPALRREVASRVSVSKEEIENLRREHPEAFQRPRKLKLRNIYLGVAAAGEAGAIRRRAREIHRRLLAGAAFDELARRESESQSASRGGALGYVDPEDLPPPVADVVRALSPGEISPPVEHGGGVSIFLCEAVREAQVPTPEEVRTKLRTQLERQRVREAWSAYRQELLEAAAPRIDATSATRVLVLPEYRLDAADLEALVALRRAGTGLPFGVEQRGELLRGWALDVLAAQRAVELGLDRRSEMVNALRWRRLEVLAGAELSRRLQAELPEPSERDLRRYLDAHRDRYRQSAAYHLEAIYFGKPDGENARELVDRAAAVARDVSAGELSFAEAARRHSRHPSAAAGGDLGWQTRRQVAVRGPTARGAIRGLRPGETTDLLHLDSGLWVFALRDEREARDLPFDEVEADVRAAWVERQLPAIEVGIRRRFLGELGVEIRSPAPPPRVVRWSTASEFENYGYHVYRGQSAEGPFERLTEEPIPGAGTTDVPHSYRYEDTTAAPGTVYFYYVEAISTSGQRRRLTPVRVSEGDAP